MSPTSNVINRLCCVTPRGEQPFCSSNAIPAICSATKGREDTLASIAAAVTEQIVEHRDSAIVSSPSGLAQLAAFTISPVDAVAVGNAIVAGGSTSSFRLVLSAGSVVDFDYPPKPSKSGIVNAANEGCIGGGGVDGAVGDAGGPNLLRDRHALPVLSRQNHGEEEYDSGYESFDDYEIRCFTGGAKTTGPGSYGRLNVPFVIHAVGPNYHLFRTSLEEGDDLLRSAYVESLVRAKEVKLEAVAFSLLSSGIFRGKRSLKHVLQIAVEAVSNFEGYEELREVHLVAYTKKEAKVLDDIAKEMGLAKDNLSDVEDRKIN